MPRAAAGDPVQPAPAAPAVGKPLTTHANDPLYYVILETPKDLNAFLQKIKDPDLEVRRPSSVGPDRAPDPKTTVRDATPWVIKSVGVRGTVGAEVADVDVDLVVDLVNDGPVWVPIRLDRQKLSGVDENGKDVIVRKTKTHECEVELAGRGEHNLRAHVRVTISTNPARKSLSLAIPACATTSLRLEFGQRESDIVVGADENFGKTDMADGKGSMVTALLEPRSSIDVSWSNDADLGRGNSPLLTARGEIEIDVDSEQMRTRSLWDIRCVRGVTRSLKIRLDDRDEVTELQLDDRQPVSGIERVQGGGLLTVELGDPLRAGSGRRLMMKTRRPYPKQPDQKLEFAGFPLNDARQQSGFIGITESANLWLTATSSPGLRRIYPSLLPQALRERPSTSLAFEFLDQPFSLNLNVSPSPPLVKARTRTVFHVSSDRAPSETTIDLEWVRGRLYEVAVDVGPGLEVSSIGPPDVVESCQTTAAPTADWPGGEPGQRKILIRLKSLARDQKHTTLKLSGDQRIPRRDLVKLGLFRPMVSTTVNASYVLYADRAISVEPEEGAGRVFRAGDAELATADAPGELADNPGPESGSAPLVLATETQELVLPIHLTRHTRSVAQETTLSAQVGRRAIDLVQKTTLSVRHGELTSIDIRVPRSLVDRWELRDREFASREELGQDADGSRHYRLFVKQRPVTDKVMLTFRSRLAISPALDGSKLHEIAIPQIACSPGSAQPAKLELELASGLVLEAGDPGWVRALEEEIASGSNAPGRTITYMALPDAKSPSFSFSVRALEPVAMPPVVVPRMMMESVVGADSAVRCRASYWVESHGPSFEFRLPENSRWITGRLDGRIVEQVDQGPAKSTYRLWFPVEVQSKPALLELEYMLEGPGAGAALEPPVLARESIVLRSLWELRLPWESTILFRPRNWSDENQWYWDGYVWKQRSGINRLLLRDWLRGVPAPAVPGDEAAEVDAEGNYRFLFSRVGPPSALDARVVSKAWIIAASAGSTVLLGLLVLFGVLRFRTIWIVTAAFVLLGSVLVQSSALVLAIESACAGLFLTFAGFLIQRSIERTRATTTPSREQAAVQAEIGPDPSSLRGVPVGSDESTAIRVRVPVAPSTAEYASVTPSMAHLEDEQRSSFLEHA